MTKLLRYLTAGLTLTLTAAAGAAGLGVRDDARLGRILTDDQGRTLYLYTKDTPGTSNCAGQCAAAWPPLTADAAPALPAGVTGTVSLVKRADGTQQVALDGVPLYYWVKDAKPGDTTGQGVGKVWYAVNPGPTLTSHAAGSLGQVVADDRGMTLYLYTKDEGTTSTCYDQCATAWPPLLVAYQPKVSEEWKSRVGTTARKDGSLQVTFDGKPLYYWFKDAQPGDATGQNVGKVWFVINP